MGKGGVQVNAGNTSVPYIMPNLNNPMQGMMRINGTDIQVFDGTNWITMNTSYATVELSELTEEAIQWVSRKMQEEKDLWVLGRQHPAVAAALENLNKAKQQLDVTIILSKEHEQA